MEKQNLKNVTILLLSVVVAACVFTIIMLLRGDPVDVTNNGTLERQQFSIVKVDTIGPVEEDLIEPNVSAFRTMRDQANGPAGAGVYYTERDFVYYASEIFPRIKQAQIDYISKDPSFRLSEYEWKIGCYWMLNKDSDDIVKYDFCFAPVLVHKTSRKVVDFFSSGNRYTRDIRITIPRLEKSDTTITTSIFNTGTMFP